ncbi:unnamed protein product [Phaedon cochleariae]|uniref:Uncharacterized protein n=1 Tax=Phaedon cochleariae TaxID=80249 RepID=A0A9P0DES0_PHACE|nr:unnamed protein product [Phaedon cochleariae]
MAVFLKISISVIVLCAAAQYSEGTMGCANFGHSCYGGYGKRTVSSPNAYRELFQMNSRDDLAIDTAKNGFLPDMSNSILESTKKQRHNLARFLKNWIRENQDEDQASILPMYHIIKDAQA